MSYHSDNPFKRLIPRQLFVRFSDWNWEIAYRSGTRAVTYGLTNGPGRDLYVKVTDTSSWPQPKDEADRLEWAKDHLPVPEALEAGSNGRAAWLVTQGLHGHDATHGSFRAEPRELVRTLAGGLHQFHSAPVSGCPFDFRLDKAIGLARRRLDEGLIDPERDFHREHQHLTAAQAISQLEDTRPTDEDLVVCHGDYCLPNILIDSGKVVGFVDLGELGVADRWWDLSVATWSLTWNMGPGYEEAFLEDYGADPDPGRISFFRLLYDMVS